MIDITKLDAVSILSDSILDELFTEENIIERSKLMLAMRDKAKILGVLQKFDTMIKAYQKVEKQMQKSTKEQKYQPDADHITQFGYGEKNIFAVHGMLIRTV